MFSLQGALLRYHNSWKGVKTVPNKITLVLLTLLLTFLLAGCFSLTNPVTEKIGPSYNLPLTIPAVNTNTVMKDIIDFGDFIDEDIVIPIPDGGTTVEIISPKFLPISLNVQNYFENELVEDLYIYYEVESDLALGADLVISISNEEEVREDEEAWKGIMGTNVEGRISLIELLSQFARPVYFALDLDFRTGGEISGENYVHPQIYLVAVVRVNQ